MVNLRTVVNGGINMRWIARVIIRMIIIKAKNVSHDEKSERLKLGYDAEIKHYEDTIELLKC
jgi:hypothetical protein